MKAAPQKSETRFLVLGSDETSNAEILGALREVEPEAAVDIARTAEEAQRVALGNRPNLVVVDLEAVGDWAEEFLLDLRTTHSEAGAIVLTSADFANSRSHLAGTNAIQFLPKPLPAPEFGRLVRALLQPKGASELGEKFHGTLSDLHLSDIIQLKCMSGSTSALAFTGPQGEEARVYFDHGQVRHAVTPGREGLEAFNEIVSWPGGKISELRQPPEPPQTINMDWQFLLMEAVRKVDETSARRQRRKQAHAAQRQKILVIDDSLMLLSFVQEFLAEANYDVVTAANGEDGLRAAAEQNPGLVLLDYLLPDIKGDEVSRRLRDDSATAAVPVLFMSGFGADLAAVQENSPNVVGIINKPFTSEMLMQAVEEHLPRPETADVNSPGPDAETIPEFADVIGREFSPASVETDFIEGSRDAERREQSIAQPAGAAVMPDVVPSEPLFSGNTDFFSLDLALRTIARERFAGVLRVFWDNAPVELYARGGQVALVTTLDSELYCSDAPITLVNIESARVQAARARQTETGEPLFLSLIAEGLIQREPGWQLVQHYGQKLFARLWSTSHVRFAFYELEQLPSFAQELPGEEVDIWAINCLRFVQAQDLAPEAEYDPELVPAYTRDGFERVQKLRLTVAEAQFASQFNGSRSLAQIARNLRLDLKSARLTLSRFLALGIVELWPASAPEKIERGGVLKRFGRSMGLGS